MPVTSFSHLILTVTFFLVVTNGPGIVKTQLLLFRCPCTLGATIDVSCINNIRKATGVGVFPSRIERHRSTGDAVLEDSGRWRLLAQRKLLLPDGQTEYRSMCSLRITTEDDGVVYTCVADKTADGEGQLVQRSTIYADDFDDPIFEGPRAVEAFTWASWLCIVPKVRVTLPRFFASSLIVYNESSCGSKRNETKTPVLPTEAMRVVTNTSMCVSDKYSSFSAKCSAQHLYYNITKETPVTQIEVFVLEQPVVSGPKTLRFGDVNTWHCRVSDASAQDSLHPEVDWFINSERQDDGKVRTRLFDQKSSTKYKYFKPLKLVDSTLTTVVNIGGRKPPPFRVKCVVTLALFKASKSAEYTDTLSSSAIDNRDNQSNSNTDEATLHSPSTWAGSLQVVMIGVLIGLILLVICMLMCVILTRKKKQGTEREFPPDAFVAKPLHLPPAQETVQVAPKSSLEPKTPSDFISGSSSSSSPSPGIFEENEG